MAIVTIPAENRTLEVEDPAVLKQYLMKIGIDYEVWKPNHPVSADAPAEEILNVYNSEIERLKAQGGYVTADVVDVNPSTPNLQALLDKFNKEHWHAEDEVRFIIEGRGIFFIHPKEGPVVSIQVGPGDLLRVLKGTLHWFHLCEERRIRAIRLFQDPAGWTPHYTDSGIDRGYVPVCMGPQDIPIRQ